MINMQVTVYVCGRTLRELSEWTSKFERFFGGVTTVQALGTWEGVTETVNMVSHLHDGLDPDFKHYELENLVREYKRRTQQETVLVTRQQVNGRLY